MESRLQEIALSVLRTVHPGGILYHYTSLYAIKTILEEGRVRLTAANGSDKREKSHGFYLSLARTTQNRYGRGMLAVIVFNQHWLRTKGKIESFNYWESMFPRAKVETETEDRFFYRKRDLILPKDVSAAISEIHIRLPKGDKLVAWQRRMMLEVRKRRIKFYIYDNQKAFELLDTRKALHGEALKAYFDLTPEEPAYQRPYRRKVAEGLKQLVFGSSQRHLDDRGRYDLKRLLSYGGYQENHMDYWNAEIHNYKNDRSFTKIYDLINKEDKPIHFFEKLAKKWREIVDREDGNS